MRAVLQWVLSVCSNSQFNCVPISETGNSTFPGIMFLRNNGSTKWHASLLGVTLWNKINVLWHSSSLHCSLTGINTKVYICIKDVGDCWMHDTWMAIIICRELVYYAYNQSDSVHVRSWPAHYSLYHVNPCGGAIKGRNILEQAKQWSSLPTFSCQPCRPVDLLGINSDSQNIYI